jgi:DNA modification methylase
VIGAQILVGDCRDILRTLPAGLVQCCVTSPPYFGLRDYGTATWEGGDMGCDHKRFNAYPHGLHGTVEAQDNGKFFKSACPKCGAHRIDAQLGLESTPEEYIAKMVAVFREVWRVLRDDGTLWVNMGDSYAAGKQGNDSFGDSSSTLNNGGRSTKTGEKMASRQRKPPIGLKPKDLCGVPWALAFALRAAGWYLRSDIIWHKPSPMPESVTDRPTKSHEYIFLLTKQERYFYDADAVAEPSNPDHFSRYKYDFSGANGRAICPNDPDGHRYRPDGKTQAHFATFPEDLIKPCILAGSKLGDTVLDPFGGSGTTGKVALELGRSAILIELNPQYAEMARDRTNVTPGFL